MNTRYTILLDEGAMRSVERLRQAYKLKNKAEVYDLATRILTWMTDQTANGREVGRSSNGEFQPLLMPYELDKEAWKGAA